MGASDQFPVRGAGGGGKGGSGSARVAQEAPDSIRSRQYAKIIDAISEGPIHGLVNGLQSVFLDKTPIQNADGSNNFQGVTVVTRNGTVDQDYIEGFGEVESEVAVSVEVTYATPVVRSLLNENLDAVRVTLRIPTLTYQNPTNGDLGGTSVTIAIDRQTAGAGWETVVTDTINDKTTSAYDRAYRIELPGNGPWEIRMRRLTPDSTESNTQNRTYWNSYTEIIDAKLRYPCTALAAIRVDAEQFDAIPTRGFHARGQIVSVPSNYDPETRAYTGVWDGTWKPAWTNNPAWVFYDAIVNDRAGLGAWLGDSATSKWALYEIARYCDELVPDGFGGMEPRFSCFLYKQQREEAYTVMAALASVFRGVSYWGGGQLVPVQDRPAAVVAQFTGANVVDGEFNYAGSDGKTRYTVALVTYNDPANFYEQAIEYVDDPEGVARYGVVETEIVAVGCKSRGQAHRLGKWLLYSNIHETDTVSFKAGLDAAKVYPGAIIQTQDRYRSGKRRGGRLAGATSSALTLDAAVTLEPGISYSISVVMPSGALVERDVLWGGDAALTTAEILLAEPLDEVPLRWSIWVMAGGDLVPETWRVISIGEPDAKNIVQISAVAHRADKFAAIEEGLVLEPLPTTTIRTTPSAVTNLVASTVMRVLTGSAATARIMLSWTPPAEGAVRYLVSWQRESEGAKANYSSYPTYDIDDVPAGTYTLTVTAINALGRRGPAVTIEHVVDQSGVAPDIQGLSLDPLWTGRDCSVSWNELPGAYAYQVQVLAGEALLREEWPTAASYSYTFGRNAADGGPHRALVFKVWGHTAVGRSANPAVLSVSNPAPAVPSGLLVEAGPGQVSISAPRPADEDLAGMIVWMHTSAEVPTTDAYKIYQGADNAYLKTGLQAGLPVYFRVAFFDAFGTTGLNVSSSVTATPTATGGIRAVSELPADPDEVGGELAVFLDSDDLSLRGLWGWDGAAWVFTRSGANLVAHSVAADRLAVVELSAISANLGTMTAGNITLDALGWIRGGAASWSVGKGFWQGYHSGEYKWRVGQPGGAGAWWDGSAFTLYDQAGAVAFSSGGGVTFIANAAVKSAHIDDLAVTSAKVANVIQSSNYAAGSSGWAIRKDGSIEARNITARGDIQATSISASSANIVSTLHLQGQAVTFPVYASASSLINVATGSAIVLTAAADPAGGSTMAIATVELRHGSNTAADQTSVSILAPDGSTAAQFSHAWPIGLDMGESRAIITLQAFSAVAGTFSIRVAGGLAVVGPRTLGLLGCKR